MEIDAEGEIDAAEGVTNKAIRLCWLTFIPFGCWRHSHNLHHGTSADLDHRGVSDIWTLTVELYLAAPKRPCLYSVLWEWSRLRFANVIIQDRIIGISNRQFSERCDCGYPSILLRKYTFRSQILNNCHLIIIWLKPIDWGINACNLFLIYLFLLTCEWRILKWSKWYIRRSARKFLW